MRVAVLGVVQQCKKKQKQKLTVRVHVWRACQVAPRPWMAGCMPSGAQGEPVAGQWRRAGQRQRCRNPQNENRNGKKKPQAREDASPWTSQGSSELWGARQNVGTPRHRTQCPRDGCSSEAWGTNRTTRGKALRTVHSPRGGWSSWPGARLARIQGSGRGQNAQAGVGTGQGRDHRTCLQNRPGGRMTDVEELLSSGTLPPGGKSFDPNGLRLDFIPHFMYSTCRLERFAACN